MIQIARQAAVLAGALLGLAAAAQAGSVGPSNLGSVSTLNDSIADSFASQPASSSNPLYNFVDVYTFTFTGPTGTASGSAISFSAMVDGAITNLQGAVFALPSSLYSGVGSAGTYLSSQGDTSGALNPWTTINLGTGSATTFTAGLVNGQSYAVEIRGFINSAGASYGGNLTITAVPEPSAAALALLGLAGMGLVIPALRRRR
jgi:hypothetical protein